MAPDAVPHLRENDSDHNDLDSHSVYEHDDYEHNDFDYEHNDKHFDKQRVCAPACLMVDDEGSIVLACRLPDARCFVQSLRICSAPWGFLDARSNFTSVLQLATTDSSRWIISHIQMPWLTFNGWRQLTQQRHHANHLTPPNSGPTFQNICA